MTIFKYGKHKYPLDILAALGNAIVSAPLDQEPYWDEVTEGVTGLGQFGMRCFKSRTLVDGEPIYITINALSLDEGNTTSYWSNTDQYWGMEPGYAGYWNGSIGYLNLGIVIAVGRSLQEIDRTYSNRRSQCLIIERQVSYSIEYPEDPWDWLVVIKPTSIFISIENVFGYIGVAEPIVDLIKKPVFLFTSSQSENYVPSTCIDGEINTIKNGYLLRTNYGRVDWPAVTMTKAGVDRRLLTYPYYLITNYGGQGRPIAIVPDIQACGLYQASADTFFNFSKGFFKFDLEGIPHLFLRPNAQIEAYYYYQTSDRYLCNAFFNNDRVYDIKSQKAPLLLIAVN